MPARVLQMSDVPRSPADAAEFVNKTRGQKPQLMVHAGDLPATARALRDVLASCRYLFEREVPVKLVQPRDGGPMRAVPLTANNVVIEAHDLCQPVKIDRQGELVAVTLPERVARMYLDIGEWNLRVLAGITTAPVLAADGSIRDVEGYDAETGLWCCKVPKLDVPERPSFADAQTALRRLRATFTTFPFADAVRQHDPYFNVDVVDLAKPAARDESAFLVALLTAICRPSLWLAPGFLNEAPALSGAGTGKGLLVRSICAVAFGIRPRAFTAGHDRQELEKRIAADLVQAAPTLFLDNVNGAVLRSDTLATAITERPARVRVFGELSMAVSQQHSLHRNRRQRPDGIGRSCSPLHRLQARCGL
jgi:putative DNA primase/helicase